MQSSATFGRRIGSRSLNEPITPVTPGDEYNQSHNEAKLTRQIKALKDNFGMGSLLSLVSLVVSLITVVILVGTPVYRQGEAAGSSTKAIERLELAQKENKDEQARALTDAVARIEAAVKQSVDLAQQNREDLRAMSERIERRVDKVETMAQSNWNWMVELKNNVGELKSKINAPK